MDDTTEGEVLVIDFTYPDPSQWKLPTMMELSYSEVRLDKVWVQQEWSGTRFSYLLNPRVGMRETLNEIMISLQAATLGCNHKSISVYLPENGWDAVKDRFFPRWLLKWFPPKYVEFELDVRLLYPFLKPPITDSPVVVLLRKNENRPNRP